MTVTISKKTGYFHDSLFLTEIRSAVHSLSTEKKCKKILKEKEKTGILYIYMYLTCSERCPVVLC